MANSFISIKNRGITTYIMTLLIPIAGLIYCIRNFRSPYAKNVFFVFCIFCGLIFIYNPNGGSNADSSKYVEAFRQMHSASPSFIDLWNSIYTKGSNSVDIYQPVLTFIVSKITGNPHFLFLCFAIVFGYFYSRNLWYIYNEVNQRVTLTLFLFMLGFALICPIWGINGVRMWTALHVFVYGSLPYLLNRDKKRLIWCLLSVFFHFSFIVPLIILMLYTVLPKKNLGLYFSFFVISSVIKELDFSVLHNSISSHIPNFLVHKVDSYMNTNIAVNAMSRSLISWHVIFYNIAESLIIYLMAFILYIKGRKRILDDPHLLNLFNFALFIYAFSHILALIPSGGRFIALSKMFMYPTFILFLDRFRYVNAIKIVANFTAILLIYTILFSLRTGTSYFGISIFGNPFLSFFGEDTTPLIQYVKQIFVF